MNYLQKKKLAFMSIVNQIKGFVRTVLGVPPLTLPDCVDNDSIINYTIDGNSVQDGTPTPENPVEVESVGEKTINLFPSGEEKTIISNGIEFISDGKGTYTIHGTSTSPAIATFNLNEEFTFPISVSNGGTGVLHFNNDTANNNAVINFYKDDVKVDSWTIAPSMRISSGYVALGGKVCNQIRLYISANTTVNMTLSPMVVNNIVEPTPFEPFGYKIPVVCSGKNLFNSNDWYNQLIKYATNTFYGVPYKGKDGERSYIAVSPATGVGNLKYKPINFKEKTAYTFSFYGKIASSSNAIGIYYTDGKYDAVYVGTNKWNRYTITSNPSKTISYIGTIWAYNTPLFYSDIQLEEGGLTDYEPYVEPITTNIYLDEPLRKVGDYVDSIDFKNQKLIQHIYHEKITAVLQRSSLKPFLSEISKCPIKTGAGINVWGVLSNKFEKAIDNTRYDKLFEQSGAIGTYITSGGLNRIAYTFKDSSINTVELAQSAIGDGFDVYYRLDTPLEIDIDLPKLPTIKGTTIYSTDTKIQPSNMEATYYSTSKE